MKVKRTIIAEMVKTDIYILLLLSFLVTPVGCSAQSHNSVGLVAKDDCDESSINYDDDPNLTRQEKISRMDRALMNSLNKYERCQNKRFEAAATISENGEESIEGMPSSVSTEMFGTGSAVESENNSLENESAVVETEPKKNMETKRVLGSGKVPDDIPSADNDSVLEEQIRQAAINESDTVIKAKLWNEYRKYKGLPIVGKH